MRHRAELHIEESNDWHAVKMSVVQGSDGISDCVVILWERADATD